MLVINKNPMSVAAESYRTIRTNIKHSSFDIKYKTIVITSSKMGEGKTTVASNLSIALSQNENRVLLIDCDLRRPSIHRKFRISNEKGLLNILNQDERVENVWHKYTENLYIITSGAIPPNPSEMLSSRVMQQLLEEFKKKFDYIIIDTPPVLAVSDALSLSSKADGTIIVVKAKKTKKIYIKETINSLNKLNIKIIGTVLNEITHKKDEYIYYYKEADGVKNSKKIGKSANKSVKIDN